jgi:soluble cytochrome b562
MAVDPNTGQTVIAQPGFDMKYAGYLDPATIAALQGQQSQAGIQGQLAQSLMQAGYVPNSGKMGGFAQGLQTLIGAMMQKDALSKMQTANEGQLKAANAAAEKKAIADKADQVFKTDEAIRQGVAIPVGVKEGEINLGHKYVDVTSADEAKTAAAKAEALLPTEAQKIKLETQGKIAAATAAADVANRRGYVVSDAAGNQHIITPQGKEIFETTSPGGGKLTPTQTELNAVDVEKAKQLQVRGQAAIQLQNNANNWAAKYLGVDPQTLQSMKPEDVAKKIRDVPLTHAAMVMMNPQMGGLDAISNDMGINAAGTKRATVTDALVENEKNNTMSRNNTPGKNADIYLNHMRDVEILNKDIAKTTGAISSRQAPGTGAVPLATPGPTNPAPQAAPTQTAINPKTRQRIGLVNGQWVPVQ